MPITTNSADRGLLAVPIRSGHASEPKASEAVPRRIDASPVEPPVPPIGFREVTGLLRAQLAPQGPQFAMRRTRVSDARKRGILYEKAVHAKLFGLYLKYYVTNPWFCFVDDCGTRWCQPDGLLIDIKQGIIVIVEVKHSHIGEAWWKLHKMYLPVVRKVFGPLFSYRCVEIVRYYNAAEPFPLEVLCEKVHLAPPLPHTGVHIYNTAQELRRGKRR